MVLKNKVYCHTSFKMLFKEGEWFNSLEYISFYDVEGKTSFTKEVAFSSSYETRSSYNFPYFGDYFYTEQEYRDKQIDKLF